MSRNMIMQLRGVSVVFNLLVSYRRNVSIGDSEEGKITGIGARYLPRREI
jgi:hypothetical protein